MTGPLPIEDLRPTLTQTMQPRPGGVRLIVEAPTGSGKSTQIPRMLINDGLVPEGQVVVLQPRRIAARLLARRVAREQGVRLGDEVGYQVRFEQATSERTRIRFVTEGILLRELLNDPHLRRIGAIVFDEFHERHLYGDITLARALDLQATSRPDLALLVMSATLDAGRLENYLAPCQVLRSQGRVFPVETRYSAPRGLTEEPWDHVARVGGEALRWRLQPATPGGDQVARGDSEAGHVLIFMPGAYEIRKTIEAVRREKWSREFEVLPLHGELSPADQDRAVDPDGRRRIIVATNVAETSLTIEGVTVVIDSGLARKAQFDAGRGLNTLTIQKISQASAQQRAGRAGRTAAGLCLRLWSEADHARRPAHEVPEILRMDLAEVALTLLATGVSDLAAFRWLEAPDARALAHAIDVLRELRAADPATGAITPLGRRLVRYPLHPRQSRVMEAAREAGCVEDFALLIALLQGRPLLGKPGAAVPARFVDGFEFSDLQPLLRAWDAAQAANFDRDACVHLGVNGLAAREAGQLAGQLRRVALQATSGKRGVGFQPTRGEPRPGFEPTPPGNPTSPTGPTGPTGPTSSTSPTSPTRRLEGDTPPSAETFAKILLTGFSDQVARRTSLGGLACDVVGGRRGQIPKESLIRGSPLVVAAEVREVEGREVQVVLNHCTAIEEQWLADLFPHDYRRSVEAMWDETQRRVLQKEQIMFRDLVLSTRQSGEPDPDRAAEILAAKVISGELKLTAWDDDVNQWISRLNCLAKWMPELDMPALTDDDRAFVIAQMCHGAASYKEIKEKSPWNTLRSWLGPQQAAWLDQHVPERLKLADGRLGKIVYSESADPVISARIQQLYGMDDTPRIAAGRIPLVVSISGPNQRPLQITKDLAGFWKNHYPKLKPELARKYPKHEWR